jgi:hypothetical protein
MINQPNPKRKDRDMKEQTWTYCTDNNGEGNHEYAEYYNDRLCRDVCWTCDPESSANAHRPAAQEELALVDAERALDTTPVGPAAVWFWDEYGEKVPFGDCEPDKNIYYCPYCQADIRWYQAGPDSTRWACDCDD